MTILDAGLEPTPLACPACGCDLGDPNCCTTYVNEEGLLIIAGRVVCAECLETEQWCPGGPDHLVAEIATRLPRGGAPCS